MEFRILGPLDVVVGEREVALRSAKQRALLAILLLHANEVVASDRLIDGLWGERPPRTAAHALQVFVSELRRALRSAGEDGDRILTRAPGYAIRVEPDELDLHRFERLAADGTRALAEGRAGSAATRLREALSLWRGAPLADFAYEPFAQGAITRLEELRLAAVEERIEADLALGRHRDLVAELEELTARHPLRERLRGQLMLALYRSGRQAEALAVYASTRRLLVDELGIEPKPALQALEKAILLQDPALEPDAVTRPPPSAEHVTLLFTDIEGSTRLLEALGERYADLLSDHHRLLRAAFRAHGGREVDAAGDGFFVVFDEARDALAAAAAGQRALDANAWADGAPRVRMALHTGAPMRADGAYVGLDVHRAARICAAANGRQILLSRPTRELVASELPDGVDLRDLGEFHLRDLPTVDHLFQAVVDGLENELAPPRVDPPDAAQANTTEARSILVVAEESEALESMVSLAGPLAQSEPRHDLVLARTVADATELGRASRELHERRQELLREGVAARVAAFVAAEPARDVVRLAADQDVDLVLLDARWGLAGGDDLSGEVRAILAEAPSDVAICIARGAGSAPSADRPVVVPFGGNEHDWAALELGAWLASAHGALLQLLGVAGDPESDRRDASRLLATASLAVQQLVGIATEPVLVPATADAILGAARAGALVVAGLAGDWAQSGLGDLRRALVASAVPTVLVRRGVRPGGLAPHEGLTRYTWSLASVRPPSAAGTEPT